MAMEEPYLLKDEDFLENRPTAPGVFYFGGEQQRYSLPFSQLSIDIDFQVSTAFGKLEGTWINSSSETINAIFALPLTGVVTSVNMRIGSRIFETAVVSDEEMADIEQATVPVANNEVFSRYIPDMFRLPVSNIGPGEHIKITASFLEPLEILDKAYKFRMPLSFPLGMFPQGTTIDQYVQIRCSINSLVQGMQFASETHMLHNDPNRPPQGLRVFLAAQSKGGQIADFEMSYSVPTDELIGSFVTASPSQSQDGFDDRRNFALFVTPPNLPPAHFGRDIIFLMDRSYSMSTGKFDEAVKGLSYALNQLTPGDRYDVYMFNNQYVRFSDSPPGGGMDSQFGDAQKQQPMGGGPSYPNANASMLAQPANGQNITAQPSAPQQQQGGTMFPAVQPMGSGMDAPPAYADTAGNEMKMGGARGQNGLVTVDMEGDFNECMDFVRRHGPSSTTDIMTPLMKAYETLYNNTQFPPVGQPQRQQLIILITDGAVRNEKQICEQVQSLRNQSDGTGKAYRNIRVMTFGIGTYCNTDFLKMLSLQTRGVNAISVYNDKLFSRMQGLMNQASTPYLKDVDVHIEGSDKGSTEIYPYPVPDVYIGSPLTVAGKFRSSSGNPRCTLTGYDYLGQTLSPPDKYSYFASGETLPIDKIFLKQRIDALTAQYWFREEQEIREQIVQLSTAENFPSKFTTMVAYETTEAQKDKEEEKSRDQPKKKGGMSTGKKVAALAVGGVVVLGAAAVLSGVLDNDIGGVAAGAMDVFAGAGDAIGGFFGGAGDALGIDGCCCDGCLPGDCGCDGLAEFFTCGACGDCNDLTCGIFDGCDGCELPDCGGCELPDCGGCELPDCDGLGECFSGIGECLGGIFDGLGDLAGD